MRVSDLFLRHLESIGAAGASGNSQRPQNTSAGQPKVRFEDALRESESKIFFSKHAKKRLDERGIELSEGELRQLGSAIEMAQAKGIKDTLVLIGGKAFIVNTPTGTVITVVDGSSDGEPKVFSNLNGAVVL
ncbi:MAG TPA: hypothetical protein PK778_05670 [Bacillota bacterium]|nr:hypothetical protein [Bacillota bacterium]